MAQVLPAERDLRRIIGDGEGLPDGEVEGLPDDVSPAPDKELLIAPGAEHGAPVLEDPATRAAVDAWLAVHSPG